MNEEQGAGSTRGVALGGAAYLLLQVATTLLWPAPGSLETRRLLSALWLSPPAVLALGTSMRRARTASGAMRGVWAFLATASALHLLAVASYLWRGLFESPLGSVLGLVAHHGFFVFLAIGLLLRPDRPRDGRDLRAAAHDALLALAFVAFVATYALLLVPEVPPGAAYLLLMLEEALPAVLALRLSLRLPEPPAGAYRLLAAGLGGAALLGLRGNWLHVTGGYVPWDALDMAWSLPALGILAAASAPTGSPVLAAAEPGEGPRSRLAALAVAAPPLVDLGARALGLPGDTTSRSLLALSASAVFALLAGLRLRQAVPDQARPLVEVAPHEDASELTRLALGTAHELNNPLMAVVVAAELAVARGGAEEPLRALQQAAHDTAAVVRRLQVVAAARSPEGKAPS